MWAIRKDTDPDEKQRLNRALLRSVTMNLQRLEAIAQDRAPALGMSAQAVQAYLQAFVYRLGEAEERAIAQFEQLLHEHHLS